MNGRFWTPAPDDTAGSCAPFRARQSLESPMIFDFILAQLDGELARLERLRAIVAGLGTPPAVALVLPEPAPEPEQPSGRRDRPRKDAGAPPQQRLPKPRTPEGRALTNVIPAGPVVVSAAALKEKATQRTLSTQAIPETPEPDPESLLRELSQRWGTGASAHPA